MCRLRIVGCVTTEQPADLVSKPLIALRRLALIVSPFTMNIAAVTPVAGVIAARERIGCHHTFDCPDSYHANHAFHEHIAGPALAGPE